MKPYNGRAWFWLADDGRVYGSTENIVGTADDGAYKDFINEGASATIWPRDDAGQQTLASLQDVVGSFGITVPGGTQVPTTGITNVGVLPSHRRQGVMTALMRH